MFYSHERRSCQSNTSAFQPLIRGSLAIERSWSSHSLVCKDPTACCPWKRLIYQDCGDSGPQVGGEEGHTKTDPWCGRAESVPEDQDSGRAYSTQVAKQFAVRSITAGGAWRRLIQA